jgi:hypothetical protein
VLGPNGIPQYDPKQTISITDVMQLTTVTFASYTQPDIIREVISQTEELKNQVEELKEQKNQKDIQKQQKIYEAQKLAEVTTNTKTLLLNNPMVLPYKKYESLKKIVNSGKNHNTEIVLVPEGMMDNYKFTQSIVK